MIRTDLIFMASARARLLAIAGIATLAMPLSPSVSSPSAIETDLIRISQSSSVRAALRASMPSESLGLPAVEGAHSADAGFRKNVSEDGKLFHSVSGMFQCRRFSCRTTLTSVTGIPMAVGGPLVRESSTGCPSLYGLEIGSASKAALDAVAGGRCAECTRPWSAPQHFRSVRLADIGSTGKATAVIIRLEGTMRRQTWAEELGTLAIGIPIHFFE